MEWETSNFISHRNAVRLQNQFVRSLETGNTQQVKKQTAASNRRTLQVFPGSVALYRDHPELNELSLFCVLEKAEQISFKFYACLFKFTLGMPEELP